MLGLIFGPVAAEALTEPLILKIMPALAMPAPALALGWMVANESAQPDASRRADDRSGTEKGVHDMTPLALMVVCTALVFLASALIGLQIGRLLGPAYDGPRTVSWAWRFVVGAARWCCFSGRLH